jgi:hypothetical protein
MSGCSGHRGSATPPTDRLILGCGVFSCHRILQLHRTLKAYPYARSALKPTKRPARLSTSYSGYRDSAAISRQFGFRNSFYYVHWFQVGIRERRLPHKSGTVAGMQRMPTR